MIPQSNKHIFTFICDILNPNLDLQRFDSFEQNDNFWNRVVSVGSANLVLPSLYQLIKTKKLTRNIPPDLYNYLSELNNINLNRNKKISEQIHVISKIFDENNINHVFLKGSAILLLDSTNIKYSRMIGDIDILVSNSDVNKAYELLIKSGYNNKNNNDEYWLSKQFSNQNKHLPRLVHKNHIAAVEIHRFLVEKEHKNLLPAKKVLKSARNYNNVKIPSIEFLIRHLILNWAYGDNGKIYKILNLRSVSDFYFFNQFPNKKNFNKNLSEFILFDQLLKVLENDELKSSSFNQKLFTMQLNSKLFNLFYRNSIKFFLLIKLICSRIFRLFSASSYRENIFRKPSIIFFKIMDYWKKI